MARSLLSRILTAPAEFLDRRVGWEKLWRPVGILTLAGLRTILRAENLYDTGTTVPTKEAVEKQPAPDDLECRTVNGSYNDLGDPAMGSVGCRFGRNVPLDETFPQQTETLLQPNPRLVSRALLTRERFIPATTLSLLAGAWLQFEVHDWFSHGDNDPERAWELELAPDDEWPQRPMRIPRTRRDETWKEDGTPPTFVSADTHWWDGSQIYGDDPDLASALRAGEGGRLRMEADGLFPADLDQHVDLRGVAGNFWVGLGILHTLFMHEHNAICERLGAEYPGWSDDKLYAHARLINAALMAKIHTVEWTPAIIAHPTTQLAMRANWWGILGEGFKKRFGRIGSSEILSGIPGSPANHNGVPYSLTEEFVAVYRMHPLIPDDYTFRSVEDDSVVAELTFPQLGALDVRKRLEEISMPSALYSFGIEHPGAITLHNYPYHLQNLHRPDGEIIDLAATDVLRVRERGVPRYKEFREQMHRRPVATFEELTGGDTARAKELADVYEGDFDALDLMVGLYSEPLPAGFGFSDTAFRVFILMASRRLKSDRFFTDDYRPEVYTPVGMEWLDNTTMVDVLLRHYPSLAPALEGVENAFTPWKRVSR